MAENTESLKSACIYLGNLSILSFIDPLVFIACFDWGFDALPGRRFT